MISNDDFFDYFKFYVISVDRDTEGERYQLQKEQFKKIGIPEEGVIFFQSNTPETINWGGVEKYENLVGFPKTIQCCLKSHYDVIKAIREDFSKKKKEEDGKRKKQYAIVLEDDVFLLENLDFLKAKLLETAQLWEKAKVRCAENKIDGIDFVSLSYHMGWLSQVPFVSNFELLQSVTSAVEDDKQKDNFRLNWEFRGKGFTLWGMQCYLVDESFCDKFFKFFYEGRKEELKEDSFLNLWKVHEEKEKDPKTILYSCKRLSPTPDATLPFFFSQGFVYPMLGIEKIFETCISKKDSPVRERQYKEYISMLEKKEEFQNFKYFNL